MATNSTIALAQEDNSVVWIICYYDGYPSFTGHSLVEHYDTYDKVSRLILLGHLDSLLKDGKPFKFEEGELEYYKASDMWEYYDQISRYLPDSQYDYLFYKGKWCLVDRISDDGFPRGVSIGAIPIDGGN
jgi:hypothetical protein